MKNFAAAFFDLDGTLVDNYTAIWRTFEESFLKFGFAPPTLEEVRRSVGGSVLMTAKKLLPGVPDSDVQRLCEYYMLANPKHVFDGLAELPGAAALLRALKARGVRIACFTNKHVEAADAVLERLGLARFMERVCATTLNSPRKPDRDFGMAALKSMGVSAGESLFVGDSPYDWKSAENVGAACALVATGSDSEESLRASCPSAIGVYGDLAGLGRAVFGVEI